MCFTPFLMVSKCNPQITKKKGNRIKLMTLEDAHSKIIKTTSPRAQDAKIKHNGLKYKGFI